MTLFDEYENKAKQNLIHILNMQPIFDGSPIKLTDNRIDFPLCYGITHKGELRRFTNFISKKFNCVGLELVDDVNFGLPQEAWTIIAINQAAAIGRTIHFNITYMEDIPNIIQKRGKFANALTSKELRYVYENWNSLKNNIIFWKDDVECSALW